jgi:dihydropteroate synthase
MHNRGTSRDMYREAVYDDAPRDVVHELRAAIDAAAGAGIARESIIVDPGIGFAKRAEHSYEVLARLGELRELYRPILAGPSRKSFLKQALGDRAAGEREWGTAAAVAASVLFGAHVVRVHDVLHMADVVRVADRITAAYR